MGFDPSHDFNRSRISGIKAGGFEGLARRTIDWENYKRFVKDSHVRRKPKMVAASSASGFGITKTNKHK